MKKIIEIKKKTVTNNFANTNNTNNTIITTNTNTINIQIKKPIIVKKTYEKPEIFNITEFRKSRIDYLINKLNYLTTEQITILEKSIFDKVTNDIPINNNYFKEMYNEVLRHLLVNLDPECYIKNDYLKTKILNKEIQVSNLISMNSRELFPEKWTEYNEKEKLEINLTVKGVAYIPTTLYTCGKCKKNDCVYLESQSRSSDEGSTHYITCMNCGNKWKHNN